MYRSCIRLLTYPTGSSTKSWALVDTCSSNWTGFGRLGMSFGVTKFKSANSAYCRARALEAGGWALNDGVWALNACSRGQILLVPNVIPYTPKSVFYPRNVWELPVFLFNPRLLLFKAFLIHFQQVPHISNAFQIFPCKSHGEHAFDCLENEITHSPCCMGILHIFPCLLYK